MALSLNERVEAFWLIRESAREYWRILVDFLGLRCSYAYATLFRTDGNLQACRATGVAEAQEMRLAAHQD